MNFMKMIYENFQYAFRKYLENFQYAFKTFLTFCKRTKGEQNLKM